MPDHDRPPGWRLIIGRINKYDETKRKKKSRKTNLISYGVTSGVEGFEGTGSELLVLTKAPDWRWFNLRIDEIKELLEATDESRK